MCGIFGVYDPLGPPAERAALDRMGRAIAHRGPDDRGLFIGESCALGNERLAVIDPAGGRQPFASDDGAVVVVQNGEIFNYVELADELRGEGARFRSASDTEVILRLYERFGIKFVRRLNGMFAIAIWDAREPCLWLIRDRIGIKPLFTWRRGGAVRFASEIKCFLADGLEPAPDYRALHHFLGFNYVPPPLTAFAGVEHVLPGTIERHSPEGCHVSRWWSLLGDAGSPTGASSSAWDEELCDLLSDAVRIRMRADVPYGAFLSGGVDSSTVVAMMSGRADAPVRTFGIGFEDERYDESCFSLTAARRFGTVHRQQTEKPDMMEIWPRVVYYCDQPHGDVSFLPTLKVATLAAEDVTVVLTGDGGDELFAGYDKYRDFFHANDAEDESRFRESYARVLALFGEAERRRLYCPGPMAAASEETSRDLLEPLFDESVGYDRINRALHLDMSLLLPGNNLVKPDRMGMAVSLEARTPMLDYRVMEFAFRTRGSAKLRDGETKYAFKRAVAPLIGSDLAYRRKRMFTVPIGEWFRGRLAGLVRGVLESERARARGLFEPEMVSALVSAHVGGRENRTRELRALFALELWFRVFIDRSEVGVPDAEQVLGAEAS